MGCWMTKPGTPPKILDAQGPVDILCATDSLVASGTRTGRITLHRL